MVKIDYNKILSKIKDKEKIIIEKAIIKDIYFLNEVKKYIDLLYIYSYVEEELIDLKLKDSDLKWDNIKDNYLLEELSKIRIERNRNEHDINFDKSIDYKKILKTLNELQKYLLTDSFCFNKKSFFDFINEVGNKKTILANDFTSKKNKENIFCESVNFSNEKYEVSSTDIFYESSYFPTNTFLKISKNYNRITNENRSVYAVIHNLLIRTDIIPLTNYLNSLNLNSEELNKVYYFQIIILNAIKNGGICLNDNNLVYLKESKQRYFKIAKENINYYVDIFNKITKEKTKKIRMEIETGEFAYPIINDHGFKYKVLTKNERPIKKTEIWFDKKIEYVINEENRKYFEMLLYEIFGFESFREGQLETIKIIMDMPNKVLPISVFPTGYGKSIIYQMLAVLQPLKTIIISPTEILIYDQIVNLHEKKFDLVDKLTLVKIKKDLIYDSLITYASIELFMNEKNLMNLDMLDRNHKIYNIVLDECHHSSIWGHNFNPSYFALSKSIIEKIQNSKITMFTATASNIVLQDIKNQFSNKKIKVLSPVPLDRGNIQYTILKKDNINSLIKQIVKTIEDKYETGDLLDCSNENETNLTLIINNDKKVLDDLYKEFLGNEKLKRHVALWDNTIDTYDMFRSGLKTILLANDDFIVGINIPNLINVICIGIPPSKEWLYQEGGRVGRLGQNSNIIIAHLENRTEILEKILDLEISNINIEEDQYIDVVNKSYIFDYMKDIEKEIEAFKLVYKGIEENICGTKDYGKVIISLDSKGKKEYDFIIYILYLIGFIKVWLYTESIRFRDREGITSYKLLCRDLYFEKIDHYIMQATQVIHKASFYKNNDIIKNIENSKTIENIVFNMINWVHRNVLMQKKQMLTNTCELIEEYNGDSAEMECNLSKYFNINVTNIELEKVLQKSIINKIYKISKKNSNINKIKKINNAIQVEEPINEEIEDINVEEPINEEMEDINVEEPINEEMEDINIEVIEKNAIDYLIEKLYEIRKLDNEEWEIIEEVTNNINNEELQIKCEKIIEERFSLGIFLILAIKELRKNRQNLIRFSLLSKFITKEEIIKIYKMQKKKINKVTAKKAKKIIIEKYPTQNIIEKIKDFFI